MMLLASFVMKIGPVTLLRVHHDVVSGMLVLPIILLLLALCFVVLGGLLAFLPRVWYACCCELAGEPEAYSTRDPLPPKRTGHW